MGFSTPLSGLKAAATNLQVTGNNIANSQTTGFKESRAEFADVYASNLSLGGASKTQPGSGVRVAEVAQQFNQGNIDTTQNSLDLAIKGNGFFVLADQVNFPDPTNRNAPGAVATPIAYTRDGAFKLDSKGTVVNSQGQYLLAYAHGDNNTDTTFSRGVFKPITLDTEQGAPKSTANVDIKLNLDVSKPAPSVAFDRTNPKSYSNTTAVSIYDSEGNAHVASTYYVKDPLPATNSWKAYLFVDDFGITPGGAGAATVGAALAPPAKGGAAGTPISLTFTPEGLLNSVNGQPLVNGVPPTNLDIGTINLSTIDPGLSVNPLKFDVDFLGSTQFSTPFSVNGLKQDGLPVGNLTGIDVDGEGVVFARYSNGSSKPLGQVAMARFNSNQSLSKLGDTAWGANSASGEPIYGTAGSNNFGDIQGSALEGSNVDLSEQLVKLIIAQQAYQANAQSITTEKSLLETILRA
ncbi:MAG: flagellar hook protein FlgE [Methylococcaceae bacterium]|nr:flagellar hook protein FlgE [Methylococcaceae bacterium]